jgi:phosphate starvation-inducible PhoH-like protein
MQIEETIQLRDAAEGLSLLGQHDRNLRAVQDSFKATVVVRDGQIRVSGDEEEVRRVARVFHELLEILRKVGSIQAAEVEYVISMVKAKGESEEQWSSIFTDNIEIPSRRRTIRLKNLGQKRYLDAIRNNDIVFGIGPAGTGKTYVAMGAAVSALDRGLISRIILTRPAVEAGESLGFLPGSMLEKVNPYLRPLYDALHDMMDVDRIARCFDRDMVEVAPLAFMRGRTLNDCFIILDEAQNTTHEQMKMFLTRLGHNSKTVVTGDVTQIDLPPAKRSGLVAVEKILKGIPGIAFVYFGKGDVVRHRLVQDIVDAYEKREQEGKQGSETDGSP